tara:strand:+ start:1259 stop:1381 length:123 start_codon:yes stop_codon:yes gene_type:complete
MSLEEKLRIATEALVEIAEWSEGRIRAIAETALEELTKGD